MMMRFGHIELFVSELVKSKAFYRDILGFTVTAAVIEQLIWIQLGSLEILLRQGEPQQGAGKYEASAAAVVLYTDNLTTAATTLTSRGLLFRGTVDLENCLTFTDLDGNWFQHVDPNDH